MRLTLTTLALASLAAVAASPASAYVTYSGVDNNGSGTRLLTTPNSTGAENSFRSNLTGVGTETFETQTVGASAPLVLNFGVAGTATLSGGGAGTVTATSAGTISVGRYSVPGGTNYWDVSSNPASSFQISFSQEIAAFGFYGIDIGDFQGTVQLELLDNANSVVGSLNLPTAAEALANGSVLYFGLIASNSAELFRSIRFNTALGGVPTTDVFGFDSFTIGTQAQVTPRIPEPGTLALLGAALLGLSLTQRRRG